MRVIFVAIPVKEGKIWLHGDGLLEIAGKVKGFSEIIKKLSTFFEEPKIVDYFQVLFHDEALIIGFPLLFSSKKSDKIKEYSPPEAMAKLKKKYHKEVLRKYLGFRPLLLSVVGDEDG